MAGDLAVHIIPTSLEKRGLLTETSRMTQMQGVLPEPALKLQFDTNVKPSGVGMVSVLLIE